jgi:hypothetical protein
MAHPRHQFTLNFGPPSLTRSYCTACNEETLHVRGQCNHCVAQRQRSTNSVPAARRARASKQKAMDAESDL